MVVWLAVGFYPYWVVALDPSIASPFQIISDLDGYSKKSKALGPSQQPTRPERGGCQDRHHSSLLHISFARPWRNRQYGPVGYPT